MKAIILAAGKGKRMNSDLPKVVFKVKNKCLINWVLELAHQLGAEKSIVVIGYKGEEVKKCLLGCDCEFVWQKEQLGTGHAVMMAKEKLFNYQGDVLILYGDVPALTKETVNKLISVHKESDAVITVLTAELDHPGSYGRMLRKDGNVIGIKEAKDASEEELMIKEFNSGIYVVNNKFLLYALNLLKNDNKQEEYYLTDIVEIAATEGKKISAYITSNADEVEGVNTVEQLAKMERILN
jgi:bifunctional UDP-N-acetylglucosamine pyrophosphorylase / glucosamine-1-phosphate N-acetyltransferase